ncbi:MAG: sulfotransferase [Deltaproteobacteria bacterium]
MIAQLDDRRYLRVRPWKFWSRLLSYGLFEGRPLTTKGRWINPLVFMFFSIVIRFPALRKVCKPVFILGMGRSGTTALGLVLSMHRKVGFLNEPKALWHSVLPCEDLIGSYTQEAACYRLGALDATDLCRKWMHRIYGAYLVATFSSRVVDKYPELIFRVPFVQSLFPDAKFLFLVRNGWETCRSIEGWSNRLGQQLRGEVHDWWGLDRRKWKLLVEQIVPEHSDLAPHVDAMRGWTDQVDMAAVEWIVSMREGLALLQRYPYDVLRVTYEELCHDPGNVMEQIREFVGLGKDEVFLQYGQSVLRPVKLNPPFILASVIERPFYETMQALGYDKKT